MGMLGFKVGSRERVDEIYQIWLQPGTGDSSLRTTPSAERGNGFAWGFTVSGNATGQARWDSPFVGPG